MEDRQQSAIDLLSFLADPTESSQGASAGSGSVLYRGWPADPAWRYVDTEHRRERPPIGHRPPVLTVVPHAERVREVLSAEKRV